MSAPFFGYRQLSGAMPSQALSTHEASPALAPPGKAELVIGAVLLGFFRVFAAAARLAAHVVLRAQAAGMLGPQLSELPFELLDLARDLGSVHIRYRILSSLFFPYFRDFLDSFLVSLHRISSSIRVIPIRDTISPCP